MLKNEKLKFFLSAIFIFIIAGFLAWQGIINISADINKTIGEFKDKKISKDVYALKEKSLAQEIEAYNFSKNKIENISNHFIYASENDDAEFTSFFEQLDSIAMQSTRMPKSLKIDLYQNGAVSAVNDKNKPGGSKNSSLQESNKDDSRLLKLTLRSNFEGLLKFISYFEAMPYYIYIESVNINADIDAGAIKKTDNAVSAGDPANLQTGLIIKIFKKPIYYEQ